MRKICRTCLQQIEGYNFINLNEATTVRTKLAFCLPTMNVHLMASPAMCIHCVSVLNSAYEFTYRCLQIEQFLRVHQTWMVGVTQEGINEDLIQGLINETATEQPEDGLPRSVTPIDIVHNNDVNSEDDSASATGNFKLQETVGTVNGPQDLTSPERLPTMPMDVVPKPDDLIGSCNEQISLLECRVVVTPLEDVIKESVKLLRPSYNEPDCASNDGQDVSRSSKNPVLCECSVVVTPLDDVLRQTIRNYSYNEESNFE